MRSILQQNRELAGRLPVDTQRDHELALELARRQPRPAGTVVRLGLGDRI